MESLNKLKAICDAATPGPWDYMEVRDEILHVADDGGVFLAARCPVSENAVFIASSRSAMPILIELVEALDEKVQTLKDLRSPASLSQELYRDAIDADKAATAAVASAKAKLEAAF